MRYRVLFREQADLRGKRRESSAEFLSPLLADGVVLDARIVERSKPQAFHSDALEEGDDFEDLETELWDYDVANDRRSEFLDAVRNSEIALEVNELGDEEIVGPS